MSDGTVPTEVLVTNELQISTGAGIVQVMLGRVVLPVLWIDLVKMAG